MNKSRVRILIIEDSSVDLELLRYIFQQDPDIEIVGTLEDGEEVLKFLESHEIDLITTDINMPKLSGIEVIKTVRAHYAIPIVVISGSCNEMRDEVAVQALKEGALAILMKPAGLKDPNFQTSAKEIRRTIKLLSQMIVFKSHVFPASRKRTDTHSPQPMIQPKIVAIGTSLGGPTALRTLLMDLPITFPLPILIVQHIAIGFVEGFVQWLQSFVKLPVRIARDEEMIKPGVVYIAPDAAHLTADRNDIIHLKPRHKNDYICPSIDHLFTSVATSYGKESIGILLTGMGSDGVEGLVLMKQKGSFTIAQDEESSTSFTLPGKAIAKGGATLILPLKNMALTLTQLVMK